MPIKTQAVTDNLTGTDVAVHDFQMPHNGVVCFDAVRTAGTLSVTVQVSLDGGTNFVNAYNESGTQLTTALGGTVTHAHYELTALAGSVWRMTSTQDSGGTATVKFGPVLAP